MKTLGEVVDFVRGITFHPGDVVPVGSAGSVVCLRTANIQRTLTDADLIAVPLARVTRPDQMVRADDILLSSANSWNLVGKCVAVPTLAYQAAAGGFISIVRAKTHAIDPRYLFRWLSSGPIQHRVRGFARQTTSIANLSVERFLSLQVPTPPLAEQRRIAAMLDKADGIRRKRQESLRLLDDLLRSTFLEMFGEPVRNEKEWKEVAIADVATVQLGKMLSDKARGGSDPVPYLRNANVQWRRFDLRSLLTMDYTSDELAKFDLRAGDLLVCEGGEVGRCAIWEGQLARCSFQKALHRVRPIDDRLRVEYLQECLFALAQRGALSQSTSQATIAHLTKERLEGLTVPLPDSRSQQVFARFYQRWAEARKRVDARFVAVDQLCEALAAQAFLVAGKS